MAETYTWEDLLAVLEPANPVKVRALQINRRRVEHGLTTVGLKLHCLTAGYPELKKLVDAVGGFQQRFYRRSEAFLTYLLPPVGNARSAVMLLECIEQYTGHALFNNPQVQIQVCSPCRLDSENAAILAVAFYLGSDVLRRYALSDLTTTFSSGLNDKLHRGRRIVLYDGLGDLDRDFQWWDLRVSDRQVLSKLPFHKERTDILSASTKIDIFNVNLTATLLSHYQQLGFWEDLGLRFKNDVEALLQEHLLQGVLQAPWVHDEDNKLADDMPFILSLIDLMNYAFAERARIKKQRMSFWRRTEAQPAGILIQMRELLEAYRTELVDVSNQIEKEQAP